MAVLVGLQTTRLNISRSLLPTTPSVLQSSVTNKQFSLNNCVDRSPFPSTLLTVDYFRWRPTIHCRLSALVASTLANYSLQVLTLTDAGWFTDFVSLTGWCTDSLPAGSLTDSLFAGWLAHSEIPAFKWACADGIVDTLPHRSYTRCTDLVTGETPVRPVVVCTVIGSLCSLPWIYRFAVASEITPLCMSVEIRSFSANRRVRNHGYLSPVA
jgi:hypothetical protein